MLHLLDQVSTDTDNTIETIEIECDFLWLFDSKELKTQWRPLEMVLDKVGFRNSLKEVRVDLAANPRRFGGRYMADSKIDFMDLFSSLRERGVFILVSASWIEVSANYYESIPAAPSSHSIFGHTY
jgi:hypothetical protein